ncbi:E3 SUMO-protein ligase NSE2-like [Tubulanus polymorphus]|uniref:E3 SUMO-protein ligase NSE2-like n=1 Tax=Tubulanus polymorphus TaxID=672921 RepID=UPI003DA46AFA
MPTSSNFNLVDQALNTLDKVKEYISAGMETTVDIATDMLEYEDEDGAQVKNLKEIMLSYTKMERDLMQYKEVVQSTKAKIAEIGIDDAWPAVDTLLDEQMEIICQHNSDAKLQQHERYLELQQKIGDLRNQEMLAIGGPTQETELSGDEDLICTQKQVHTKCPYTGLEMTNPVRNKICGHNYDRLGIEDYLKKRGANAKCPVSGCINTKPIATGDLVENRELRKYIEAKNRQAGIRRKRPANSEKID